MPTRLIAGAMSGTSADGVDVAIVEIDGSGLDMTARLVQHHHRPYPVDLRKTIFSIRDRGAVELAVLAQAGHDISQSYASATLDAMRLAKISADDLRCVAAHGQTLFHDPPNTIQWFDPALVAAEVGVPVVSDFRRADCAAGGHGAPLVPFADFILFRNPVVNRALINIGGIANLTLLPAGKSIEHLVAFDTGPGNCVSDHLMREHDPNGPGVDEDGRLAASGRVIEPLLWQILGHPYFATPGPKSTDGPNMIRIYQEAVRAIGQSIALRDQLATSCAVTARAIVRALAQGKDFTGEAIASGGGTKNKCLMNALRDELGSAASLRTTDECGIPSDAKEAVAFALLGAATLDGIPSNVPSCTGARRPAVLGSITPRP
jgi:anhydro-N-acetylmuramic acid kinase